MLTQMSARKRCSHPTSPPSHRSIVLGHHPPKPVANNEYYYLNILFDVKCDWGTSTEVSVFDVKCYLAGTNTGVPITTHLTSDVGTTFRREHGSLSLGNLYGNGTGIDVKIKAEDAFGNVLNTKTISFTVRMTP